MGSGKINRRDFLKSSAVVGAGLLAVPNLNLGQVGVKQPMKRVLGRIEFETTTLGLGGQASLQWTPDGVDPVKIILKAFDLGVNYFDTSNLYGPSQMNYGKAFRQLGLTPGFPGYKESIRESIFLTSKTRLRWAKGSPEMEGVRNRSNGTSMSAVDDLKRTLSQVFGDGEGNYPNDAYLNMILIHSVSTMGDVEAVYTGLDHPDPQEENIGALAALRDYRDGTNRTGLNPKEEKLVRHIGFSGHFSPAVMMEMIQKDRENLLDGMLVAMNSNDILQFNMQNNVIPVAQAKNMGIIAMKVFADGAMYDKEPRWSRTPEDVIRRVGSAKLPSRPLVEYSLTTPGVHTAIIGIGQISDISKQCQLVQNLSAAQIAPDGLGSSRRKEIEAMTAPIKDGKTNYFQDQAQGLSGVQNSQAFFEPDKPRLVKVTWHTAFAGNEPIEYYDIYRNYKKIGTVKHAPQTSKKPFEFSDTVDDPLNVTYQIVTVDRGGNTVVQDVVFLSS